MPETNFGTHFDVIVSENVEINLKRMEVML